MFLFLCPESYPNDKYINRCILRSQPVKFFVKKNSHPNSCIKLIKIEKLTRDVEPLRYEVCQVLAVALKAVVAGVVTGALDHQERLFLEKICFKIYIFLTSYVNKYV